LRGKAEMRQRNTLCLTALIEKRQTGGEKKTTRKKSRMWPRGREEKDKGSLKGPWSSLLQFKRTRPLIEGKTGNTSKQKVQKQGEALGSGAKG